MRFCPTPHNNKYICQHMVINVWFDMRSDDFINIFCAAKLRSYMREAVAGQRRTDLIVPAPLSRAYGLRNILSRNAMSVRAEVWLEAWFWSGCGKLGVGPIFCRADFAPILSPLRNHICVNTCNDLCWSQFSTHSYPDPPAFSTHMCKRALNCHWTSCSSTQWIWHYINYRKTFE